MHGLKAWLRAVQRSLKARRRSERRGAAEARKVLTAGRKQRGSGTGRRNYPPTKYGRKIITGT